MVEAAAQKHGLDYAERSIAEDPALAAQFAEEVPVLLLDGVQRDFWRIDPQRLDRLLTQRAAERAGQQAQAVEAQS